MRKILLLTALVFTFGIVNANPPGKKKKGKKKQEQWLDFGLRLGPNATALFNSISYFDKGMKQSFPFGYNGGAKLGYNFSDAFAFTGECHYAAFSQKVTSKPADWNYKVSMSFMEIPALFRVRNPKKWKYFEFGVKYSKVLDAKSSFSSGSLYTAESYNGLNFKDKVKQESFAAVIGWGTDLFGTKGMSISSGFRIAYGFTDMTNESKANGQNFPYPLFKGDLNNTKQTSYSPTNMVTIGFVINIDYDLGSFISSSCGRNHKFVLFKHS